MSPLLFSLCRRLGLSTYKDWAQAFPESVEICPINLPGRGFRFTKKLIIICTTSLMLLSKHSRQNLLCPTTSFGHSMGTMIAFELSRKLRLLGKELPRHLFLSARPGPALFSHNNNHTPNISDSD